MAPRKKVTDTYSQKKKVAATRKLASTKKSQNKNKEKKKTEVEEIQDDGEEVNNNQDDGEEVNNKILIEFDMNSKYGPCVGITRLERWERANKFGLNPPKEVENLLKDSLVDHQSCWNSRI